MSDPARAEQEDLVVETPHLPVVMRALQPRQVRPADMVDDPALGLTRLRKLDGLPAAAAAIRSDHREQIECLERFGRPFTELDLLLFDLRRRIGADHGGWTPLMGKNREVRGVLPQPGGGGGKVTFTVAGADGPRPVDADEPAEGPQGSGVVVGMVDTPLVPHRRLVGHVGDAELTSALFAMVENEPFALLPIWAPWQGHATFVVDRAARQAPSARFVVNGALDGQFGGATSWETAQAIASFAGSDIAILNLSIACRTDDGKPPLVLTRALQRLGGHVLVVAAAGNHNQKDWAAAPMWPAALPDSVAVGATGADFSPEQPWVTCTANGHDVVGAFLTGQVVAPRDYFTDEKLAELAATGKDNEDPKQFHGYAQWSGTSFAAATVSGAVAARMTDGRTAREAFDDLLNDQNSPVTRYVYQPEPRS